MSNLECLFGLDGYDALRMSCIGQDPDQMRPYKERIRPDYRDNTRILAAMAARTSHDRGLWARFLLGAAKL